MDDPGSSVVRISLDARNESKVIYSHNQYVKKKI